ncbi:MAG: Wzz/FepE/Etk N-terminal domain-containing protein [Paracoccaceae bacterium]
MGQIQNLEDLLNFLRRRIGLMLAIVAVGVVVSAIVAKSRPDSYQASAVIQVLQGQVAPGQADQGPGGGSAQILQTIEQRLTTRENLLAVIERHGLYADLPALTDDERAVLLRRNVTFDSIAAAGNSPYAPASQISAIIITARDGDAALSARIANDFAQEVLDMSSEGKRAQARDALAFYREEEARILDQIARIDAEVAAYKNENRDSLPSIADAQRDEIAAVDSDLRGLDRQMVALAEEQRQLAARDDLRATDQRRLQDLDGQIAVLAGQQGMLSARRAELTAALARLPEVERALAGYQRQLDQLQGSLDLVTARLAEAETEAKLADRQQGERFALLDRALTPENPVGSGGKKLFLAGAMASVLAALALAFALDLLRPVVRTSAQMERQLGLRPIVAIPELDLPTLGRSTRRGGAAAVLALPPVVLICGGLTAVLFVAAALS